MNASVTTSGVYHERDYLSGERFGQASDPRLLCRMLLFDGEILAEIRRPRNSFARRLFLQPRPIVADPGIGRSAA